MVDPGRAEGELDEANELRAEVVGVLGRAVAKDAGGGECAVTLDDWRATSVPPNGGGATLLLTRGGLWEDDPGATGGGEEALVVPALLLLLVGTSVIIIMLPVLLLLRLEPAEYVADEPVVCCSRGSVAFR